MSSAVVGICDTDTEPDTLNLRAPLGGRRDGAPRPVLHFDLDVVELVGQ